jgi:hypothetical protein
MAGDEGLVLALIADRLEVGRQYYGDLDVLQPKREWAHEALEEALDQAVYLAALSLQLRDLYAAIDAVLETVPDNLSDWQQVGMVSVPVQALTKLAQVRR